MRRFQSIALSLGLMSCLLGLPFPASASCLFLSGHCFVRDVENVVPGEKTVTFNRIGETKVWEIPLEYFEYTAEKVPAGYAELQPEDVLVFYTRWAAPARADARSAVRPDAPAPEAPEPEYTPEPEIAPEPEITPEPESSRSVLSSGLERLNPEAGPWAVAQGARWVRSRGLAGTWYFFSDIGYGTYLMNDLNALIASNNRAFTYMRLTPGSLISGGWGGFGGFGVWVTDYLTTGVEIGYLGAHSASGNRSIGQELDFPALESGAFVRLGQQLESGLILSGGFGIYSVALQGARISNYQTGLGYSNLVTDLSGQTLGLKAVVGLAYRFNPTFGLGVDAGYRQAMIPEMKVNGGPYNQVRLVNADGTAMRADYSGLFFQAGLRLYFRSPAAE